MRRSQRATQQQNKNAFVRRGAAQISVITSNFPPSHTRGRLLTRCDRTSEAAGCGARRRRLKWRRQRRDLTSLGVKPEQVRRQAGTIRGRRRKVFGSGVIPAMFWLSCISLYPERCGEKNVRGRKKLDKNLNHLSTNAGEFGNRQRRKQKKNIPKRNRDSAVSFLYLPKQMHTSVFFSLFFLVSLLLCGATPG